MTKTNREEFPCPLCAYRSKILESGPAGNVYDCPNCGIYLLGTIAGPCLQGHFMQDLFAGVKLSHAVRKMQGRDNVVKLENPVVERILENPMPSPSEQVNNMVRWFGEKPLHAGRYEWIAPETHQAIIGATSPQGVKLVVDFLFKKEFLEQGKMDAFDDLSRGNYALSIAGWDYYESLARNSPPSQKAFMALQFGEKDIDKIVDDHFRPAVEKTGFDLKRLDDDQPAGLIDDHLRTEIQTSDFVIADITHHNNGAYWEAGYAEGLGKPVIYTCRKDVFDSKEGPHFDTNHHLTVIWREEAIEEACVKLKATIRATLPHQAKIDDEEESA